MATRERRSVIKDPIKASDFNNLNMIFCCEQCSFFEVKNKVCNFGYHHVPHLYEEQLKSYNMGGKMAFCRFLEID